MQLFADELTNQNREYYKVNDNCRYCILVDESRVSMQLIESQFISSKSMVVDNNVHMQEVFIIRPIPA